MEKKIIDISAKSWKTVLDFYDGVLKGVNAPDWHGDSIDALVDSMIYGGINGIEPPYVVRICDTDELPKSVADEIGVAKQAIAEARLDQQKSTGIDADVEVEIV